MNILNTPGIEPMVFFASKASGYKAFNITSDVVSLSGTGNQPLALLENPADSGVDMWLWNGEFACSINTLFRRWRGVTVLTRGTAQLPGNMGGGANAGKARMYAGSQFTMSGGSVAKTAHIAAYQQYKTEVRGMTRLRPGQAIAWTIQGASGGGGFTGSVYFEYAELPAEV